MEIAIYIILGTVLITFVICVIEFINIGKYLSHINAKLDNIKYFVEDTNSRSINTRMMIDHIVPIIGNIDTKDASILAITMKLAKNSCNNKKIKKSSSKKKDDEKKLKIAKNEVAKDLSSNSNK